MIEEHGWGNGYEKKRNENYGRDKTVVWWVELVILHMVLLNDVQRTVVVPQIQYIAVCHGKTSSPKLQVCPETVDICSKSMEWSMFLSWCRGFFPPFKTKKNLSASLHKSIPAFSLYPPYCLKMFSRVLSSIFRNCFHFDLYSLTKTQLCFFGEGSSLFFLFFFVSFFFFFRKFSVV